MSNRHDNFLKKLDLARDDMPSKKGIMADPGRHPGSRDFMLDQSICAAINCVTNSDGYCFAPSRCEIGEDGRCKNFKKKIEKKDSPNIQGL